MVEPNVFFLFCFLSLLFVFVHLLWFIYCPSRTIPDSVWPRALRLPPKIQLSFPSHLLCRPPQAWAKAAPWTARCLRTGMCGNQSHARSACATAAPWCATRSSARTPVTAPTLSSPTTSAAPSAPTTVNFQVPVVSPQTFLLLLKVGTSPLDFSSALLHGSHRCWHITTRT